MCSILDPSQFMVFRRSTFSVVGSYELQKLHLLGKHTLEHCLQRPLHSFKCTVWVAISKHDIIGPFWFEDDNEHCVTINTDQCVQVLCKFWTALDQRKRSSGSASGSSRTVPPLHTSKESLEWLNQRFSVRLISRKCDPQWSRYSPDLNPPDFYLKDRVYVHNPQSIPDVKK